MGDTTSDNIKLIAPELETFIDANAATVDLILEDVAGQITSAVYGAKQERAQRYLAAHFLTLINSGASGGNTGASGPVEMEKVGDEQVKYSSSWMDNLSDMSRYDETKYGRVYMIIRRGCIGAFMTVTP